MHIELNLLKIERENAMEYVLKTSNLTKCFKGRNVVNDVSLNVRRGDIYGFIGRNGAGKSTFMKMICGMLVPTSGEIELFESDNLAQGKKRIGCVIENSAFYPTMTAKENMKYFSIVTGNNDDSKIDTILKFVGLSNVGNKKTNQFSLGMKQRLSIAIALIGNSDFLILDEPTNGLDPTGILEIRELLLKLNQEKNITILISSHILGELSKIATKYGVIEEGNLVDEFSSEQLTERCRSYIKLEVDNSEKAVNILKNEIGCNTYKVVDGNQINISGDFEQVGTINKALLMNNVSVRSISQVGQDLEEYFVSIMGGKQK